jgi:16S rRNA (cytosine967-C5)-methyltransferase
MKYDNQLRYAVEIIEAFQPDIPLHAWLKQYFKAHKQMGSRDRKQVAEMVYCFFRLGHAARDIPTADRVLVGIFLCNQAPVELLDYFKPDWNKQIGISVEEKFDRCQREGLHGQLTDIFPWKSQLSGAVDHTAFCKSFLQQPDLFIRVRPGYEEQVAKKLTLQSFPYQWMTPQTVRLPNGCKVDELFALNKEVVIQDYSSQRVGEFLHNLSANGKHPIRAWDCCAGSGGKSILLFDQYPGLDLYVSDIRPSILINLKKRFREAGIKKYHAFQANLSTPDSRLLTPDSKFDLVLLDAPCSGSGTWARTPDELSFFDPRSIDSFSELQMKIISNCVSRVKKGGTLVYITCSVFEKENEAAVRHIRDHHQLKPERVELISGYEQKADALFAARFIA